MDMVLKRAGWNGSCLSQANPPGGSADMFQDDLYFMSFVVAAVLALDVVAVFVFLQASA